jgi:hypothetical protein
LTPPSGENLGSVFVVRVKWAGGRENTFFGNPRVRPGFQRYPEGQSRPVWNSVLHADKKADCVCGTRISDSARETNPRRQIDNCATRFVIAVDRLRRPQVNESVIKDLAGLRLRSKNQVEPTGFEPEKRAKAFRDKNSL